MKICKVWDAEYPWDVRAAKVARSLTEAGHDVHMVARNRDGRVLKERLEECTVHRMPPLPIAANLPGVGSKLNAASMFPAFFNPRWINAIESTASLINADVILCRDIPLAPSAVWVGRRLGIPVVLDMAENYPAMIRSVWDNKRHRWSDWFVRNPRAVAQVEKWVIRNVDEILVVVEESGERLMKLGVSADRITLVSNTPPVDRLQQEISVPPRVSPTDAIELVYLGLLEAPRGIATLIDAVGICRKQGLDVRLSLIGEGRERHLFEQQVNGLDLGEDVVRFLGYVKNSEALRLLHGADIGVIPHHADESWNTTIPNKLFDYMAAGITVLSSDSPPVKRVITETGCGVAFRDRDPVDMARAITELRDAATRDRCSRAGRDWIARKYNWEQDAERLLEVIQTVTTVRKAA